MFTVYCPVEINAAVGLWILNSLSICSVCCRWLSGVTDFSTTTSWGLQYGSSAQPVTTQWCVRLCVYVGRRPRCTHKHARARVCVLWAVFVQIILVRQSHCASGLQHWPSRLNQPIQAGSRRPVGSRSYRHSGRTDHVHRCCYERRHRSQFIVGIGFQVRCPSHTYMWQFQPNPHTP